MRVFFKIVFIAVLIVISSCAKQSAEMSYEAGKCLDTHFVTASEGDLSVLVDTKGMWRVSCDEPWISLDVAGGIDRQAFTILWESNESDILSVKPTRKADIVIKLDESMTADTLRLVQQGFIRKDYPESKSHDSRIILEYVRTQPKTVTLMCCAADDCDPDQLKEWAEAGADLVVMGNVDIESEGLNVVGRDYKGLDADEEYLAFSKLIAETVNSSPDAGADWLICGQFYHHSMMHVGYPATPADYISNDFRSDSHAWQNNMYDVVWMRMQDYVSTYTDEFGHSYSADYVYVSASVLAKVYDVEVLPCPFEGMKHNPIRLTLKF